MEYFNPTPAAYMTPENGLFHSISQYVAIGSFSVLLMDTLNSLPDDLTMLRTQKMTKITGVYFMSRLFALIFILFNAQLYVTPASNCTLRGQITISAYIIYRAATSALFYVRVVAVYAHSRFIKIIFGIFWLVSLSGACVSIISSVATQVGPTPYCVPAIVGAYWEPLLTAGSEAVYDLLVCIAVTYSMRFYQGDDNGNTGWSGVFTMRRRGRNGDRDREHRLADRFLRDSRIYFAVTAAIKIPEIIGIIIFTAIRPSFTGVQIMLVYPDVAVTNILATKIYRNMKLRKRGIMPVLATHVHPTFELDRLPRTRSIRFADSEADPDQSHDSWKDVPGAHGRLHGV